MRPGDSVGPVRDVTGHLNTASAQPWKNQSALDGYADCSIATTS